MRRSLVALALLLSLVAPAAGTLFASGTGTCRDHVCCCTRRCPRGQSAHRTRCHGAGEGDAAMTGICHHDLGPWLPGVAPAVGSDAVALPHETTTHPAPPRPPVVLRSLSSPPLTPPPRSA